MAKEKTKADRRHQRIATPKGVWVAWQDGKQQNVSRVRDLNLGGLFIATPTPLALGSTVTILLSVPEGEIRGRATVRNIVPREGWVFSSPKSASKIKREWKNLSRAF